MTFLEIFNNLIAMGYGIFTAFLLATLYAAK